LKKQLGYKE
jgi:predicted methyltransferase